MQDLRRDYTNGQLRRTDLVKGAGGEPCPFAQFERWFQDAVDAGLDQPNAMTLATVASGGRPRARTVLLKDHDSRGYTFYTNTEGAKAAEIAAQPMAELLFHWHALERQVRIAGRVEAVAEDEALTYYQSRPREARLGAWASPQSQPIAGRQELESMVAEVEQRFAGVESVPLPPHWGGYRVVPAEFEFWQGRPSRLHDRFRFTQFEGGWQAIRLAP